MNLILETTTGQLVPSGVAPRLPRGGVETVLVQFVTNGVAALLPAGAPIALKLYAPSDLANPVATLSVFAAVAADLLYSGQLDTLAGGLAYLERGTLHARVSYGTPNVDSAWFQLLYGSSQSASGSKPVSLVIPQPVGMSLLSKVDLASPCLTATGLATMAIKAGTAIVVGGSLIQFANQTAVAMPAHTVGKDYAVYACSDGALISSENFTAPAGYTTTTSLKIGGYHYGPGALATAQAGGDTTPQIIAKSIWDLKYKPSANDPRGFSRTPHGWRALYPLNTTPHLLGVSAYNATIADGASLPVIPPIFGGDGAATYPNFSRFVAEELLAAFGCRLPSTEENAASAYGVTEGTSRGTDPGVTLCDAPRTSQYMYQAAGNMWEWLAGETDNPSGSFAWQAAPQGRGSVYHVTLRAPLGGGFWGFGADCGSRCVYWNSSPWYSGDNLGARACCDHIQLV
jgi:hypothetical protein